MSHVKQTWNATLLAAASFFIVIMFAHDAFAQHQHGSPTAVKPVELGASAAFDRQGRLWAVGKETSEDGMPFVTLRTSTDTGKTWSDTIRLVQERVTARGEERPKIAFGLKNEVYIVYTRPAVGFKNPHIGDIRFMHSSNGGKTFSKPVTVHANRDLIDHSFGSLVVDKTGNIYVAWIDGRGKEIANAEQKPYAGSALYYAVSTDAGENFRGDYKIADHSCECCQLSLTLNEAGKPVVMWRHVFDPNIRDHAIAELSLDGKPGPVSRATFEDWRVDACPHHGPSIAFGPDGTRHQAWFNVKEGEGGIYYTRADRAGKMYAPIPLGTGQAKQPEVAVHGKTVAIVWKQFNGDTTVLMGKISGDNGGSWSEKQLALTSGDSARPQLLHTASGIAAMWPTQNEGTRILPVMLFRQEK